ncbi:hypothetical protein HS048_22385 [Planomonospora sp. ID91781]|uniref:Hemophore-related protein n=1 Tax=Planomonospora sphaerica TaxID=161355 RepID=A0A171CT42_9ACTN|nr:MULTISPECIES: hypothetical protein [Planomonospora]MBG0823483.1 hypothetical protein [Planomonospora sp. ID91781]GAT67177.1 hypothetical protein PS9374_02830 [Planomonospora sphaerica]
MIGATIAAGLIAAGVAAGPAAAGAQPLDAPAERACRILAGVSNSNNGQAVFNGLVAAAQQARQSAIPAVAETVAPLGETGRLIVASRPLARICEAAGIDIPGYTG